MGFLMNFRCLLEFLQIFSLADHFVPRPFMDKPKATAGALNDVLVFLILPVMETKKKAAKWGG